MPLPSSDAVHRPQKQFLGISRRETDSSKVPGHRDHVRSQSPAEDLLKKDLTWLRIRLSSCLKMGVVKLVFQREV